MRRRVRICVFALCGLAGAVAVQADEPANWVPAGSGAAVPGPRVIIEAGGPAADPPVAPPPATVLPDPTKPSDKLKGVLNPPKPGAVTPGGTVRLPMMAIRARVVPKGRPAAAVLDVDGRQYTVTAGTQLITAEGVTLKVVEVTIAEVKLEVAGGAGGTIVLH